MRSIYNQRATGTISMHTLRHLLRETEHMWDCPECSDVDSAKNGIASKLYIFSRT